MWTSADTNAQKYHAMADHHIGLMDEYKKLLDLQFAHAQNGALCKACRQAIADAIITYIQIGEQHSPNSAREFGLYYGYATSHMTATALAAQLTDLFAVIDISAHFETQELLSTVE